MSTQRERIKILREKEGCTAMNFAVAIQDNVDSIRNTESGKKKVTGDMLQSIISVFGVNAHWLLTGEGEMYQSKSSDDVVESTLPVAIPASHQETLIKNHRKAKITAFVEHWFSKKSMDEQAWFEVQLGHSFPQYTEFLSNKEMEGKSHSRQVG